MSFKMQFCYLNFIFMNKKSSNLCVDTSLNNFLQWPISFHQDLADPAPDSAHCTT